MKINLMESNDHTDRVTHPTLIGFQVDKWYEHAGKPDPYGSMQTNLDSKKLSATFFPNSECIPRILSVNSRHYTRSNSI